MHNYKKAIQFVLAQIHPDTKIASDGIEAISEYLIKTGENIIKKIVFLKSKLDIIVDENPDVDEDENKDTISARDVQFAVRLAIPADLGRHAISEGTKGALKVSMGPDVNILYDISNFNPKIKKILPEANGYFSFVLQYLSAELLELSRNAARDNKRVKINKDFVDRAIKNDTELQKLGCLIGYNKKGEADKSLIKEKSPKKSPKKSVKKSDKKSVKKSVKKCPEGKIENPKTGRCVNEFGKMGKTIKSEKSEKKCPAGKIENPKTGRCVDEFGKIGKTIKDGKVGMSSRKASKSKASKRKASKSKASKRKASKRKASKRKASKRKASKRKASRKSRK
jgi:hypothetical protein